MTGREDLLQSLIEAFLMEKGTKDFYSNAAAKISNNEAKAVFHDLSLWEAEHGEYIQYLYRAIQDDRDPEGFEEFKEKVRAPLAEGGISIKELESKIERYTFVDDADALRLALEIEGKSYALYRKLSESAADRNAAILFKEMAEQELSHIDYLKKMRSRLAQTP